MTIASILRHKGHDITSVSPSAKLTDVAVTLSDNNIGAVLVRDSAQQLLGILSERDIVRVFAHEAGACADMTAAQIMTRVLHTVTPSTTVDEALSLMTVSRVRHLPVLANEKLVGIVSIGDVAKARLEQQAQAVDSLTAYVAGSV
jgi:CBS domain-containing protein